MLKRPKELIKENIDAGELDYKMFKKNFSYFNNVPIKKTYPKSVNVVTWDWQAPPETLLKKVSLENQKYIKKIQVATIQKRNFQDEIQKVICLTPEKIYKSGIVPPTNDNVQYQKAELNGLNAVDARDVAKQATAQAVKQQAQSLTEQDIKKAIEQYKAKQTNNNQGEVK